MKKGATPHSYNDSENSVEEMSIDADSLDSMDEEASSEYEILDDDAYQVMMAEVGQGNYANYREFLNGREDVQFIENLHEINCSLDHIAAALEGTVTTSLDIGANELGTAKILALLEALKKTNVTELRIYQNEIDGPGAIKIAQFLKETTIKSIDLQDNPMGEDIVGCVQALEGSQVESLHLTANDITRKCAMKIAQATHRTSLREISLDLFSLNKNEILNFIKALNGSPIRKLCFRHANLNPVDLCDIVQSLQHSALTHINIWNNNIGLNDVVEFVKRTPTNAPIRQQIIINSTAITADTDLSRLIAAIRQSCFTHLDVGVKSKALDQALKANQINARPITTLFDRHRDDVKLLNDDVPEAAQPQLKKPKKRK